MNDLKYSAVGAVLPPGMGRAAATVPPGPITVTIESAVGENEGLFARDDKGEVILKDGKPVPAVSESFMVRCTYPDGYGKSHQAADPKDLAPKIINTLRNRYGLTGEIKVTSLPKKLAAGDTVVLEG